MMTTKIQYNVNFLFLSDSECQWYKIEHSELILLLDCYLHYWLNISNIFFIIHLNTQVLNVVLYPIENCTWRRIRKYKYLDYIVFFFVYFLHCFHLIFLIEKKILFYLACEAYFLIVYISDVILISHCLILIFQAHATTYQIFKNLK